MSKIFTRTFRARWSELDASGRISPSSYLRYLIETAYDWGSTLGLDNHNYEKLGIFWLIRETEINLVHPMRHNDIFDFTIWMVNWQRVRGSRCFEVKLKDNGKIMAQGTQHVVCMDRESLRPTNLDPLIIKNFEMDNPLVFPSSRFPKIKLPQNTFTCQRQVEWSDLDAQEHVNNAVYVSYAEEAAMKQFSSLGWTPQRFAAENLALQLMRTHIQYQSPATWGEIILLSSHSIQREKDGGSHYTAMTRSDGSPVAECIMDWKMINRLTGETLALPIELENLA